jgi:DedD protein
MAARRNRQSEQAGPGWLGTLGGASLLLVAGFAVGLLAGTAWEEPDLVMDHLAGRTTELPLVAEVTAGPAEAPEPEPLARPLGARGSPPAASKPGPPVELPSVSARPPPRPPAPPAKQGFSIQVGAFDDRGAAKQLAGELRAGGFSVYVHNDDGSRGARFRVRVGPVPSREEATRLAGKLESDHQLPTWILSPDSH